MKLSKFTHCRLLFLLIKENNGEETKEQNQHGVRPSITFSFATHSAK